MDVYGKGNVGVIHFDAHYDATKAMLIEGLKAAPDELRRAVDGLSNGQLDTPYKNWSIRQITHHIADSHVHCYIRIKWALTEENPTIKAYEEADWVQLIDCQQGEGSHKKVSTRA